MGDFSIKSPAFESLGHIPKRCTKTGENVSPPLEWINVPEGTKELALICYDPDAPHAHGFTHWVVYGIPPEAKGIAEGKNNAFTEGTTSSGKQAYGGPNPPKGHGPHHYYFWLYALDTALNLKPGLTSEQLLDAVSDHIIEQVRTVGIYEL